AHATGHPADEVHKALFAGRRLPAPLPGFPACRLLVVDQFEEIFTRCTDPEERARFVGALCAAEDDPAPRPRVVLGLRADHYGNCLAHPELVRALEHGQFTVPPMRGKALRAAVEQPALAVGLTLEDGLVDRLLADLWQDSGGDGPADEAPEATALPFLAHALRETWLRRSGATLTLVGYQATGGIRQSVATTTEALYQELDPTARTALRELLLRMIQLTANAEAVRRRVDLPGLLAGRPEDGRRLVTDVCDRLAAARLVTVDQDGAQISHEALLRAWPRLRSWIREARAELLAHQQLSEAATAWDDHGRDPGYLYTGGRLERIRPWLTATGEPGPSITLTATERAFAEAAVRAARRTRRRRVVLTAVAACLALLLTGVGTFAVIERDRSQRQAAVLDSKLIAGQAEAMRPLDPAAALDLSLAAYRAAHTVEARTALLRSALSPVTRGLTGHTGEILKLAFHKDGNVLASSSKDGTVRLWDTSDPYHPAAGPVLRTGNPVAAAWRPDGRYLAGATRDTLFVWDTADPLHPRQVARVPAGRDAISRGVAFSPDGRTFAVPVQNGRVWLWDLSDPVHPVPTPVQIAEDKADRIVGEVAYSPDGRVLAASVQDESLRLLDSSRARTLEPLATVKDASVYALAFRPGGRLLVGGGKQKLTTWDTTDPAHPRESETRSSYGSLSGSGMYKSLAFHPDGRYLAGAADAARQAQFFEYSDYVGPVDDDDIGIGGKATALAYQPDGRGVMVGDDTGRITLREAPPRSVPGTIQYPGESPGKGFDPAARHVVTGGQGRDERPVEIWDIGGLGVPKRVARLSQPWDKATIVAEGRFLLSQNSDGTRFKLWHLDNGALWSGHEFVVRGGAVADENPVELSVNRDGTLLSLRGPSEKTMGIWDIRDIDRPERIAEVPWPQADGRILSGFMGRVLVLMTPKATQLWDVRDARHPRRADTVKERPSAAFGNPSAAFLVSRENTKSVEEPHAHVWSLAADGTARLTGSIDERDWTVSRLASDRTLATLSKAGRPLLWDLRNPQLHGVALPGPASKMQSLHVARDRRLLVASAGTALAIWRISDPDGARPGGDDEQLVLAEGKQDMNVVEVSPAGDLFLKASGPLAAFGVNSLVVSTDSDRLTRTLCSVRDAPMPGKQWRELLPGVTYRNACG
ncbi:WD40 repeat domain-containing protein, partial [Streptomyces sp. UNOC14_S4]|uniref:WD40 repeat domain-containing protein n=1 Tax=Streptomyces sp. UNOC14_S4 TaxID=2872340 RepID=UPI001E47BAE1